MKVSVLGLGYVGCVTAACFADLGHDVIGYDSNKKKLDMILAGKTPITEKGLEELLGKVVLQTRKLEATDSIDYVVQNSDMSFVCVGTPISLSGTLDTQYLENVCDNLAYSIKKNRKTGQKKNIVVIRSSVVPGTVDKLKNIFLDKGLIYEKDFVMATNPELLREGSAVSDFMNPPHIIIGADEKETAEEIESVYKGIPAQVMKSSIKTAELIKLVNNSWHAIKLDFANEVSSICRKTGIDSKELMDLFCSDKLLNISPYYLTRPSIGFGGSCLPKDLEALVKKSKDLGLNCVLLNSALDSNIEQINRALSIVKEEANKSKTEKIGFYGIAFKPGTDDIRGSPIVYLVDNLRSNGYDVKLYDRLIKKEQIENIKSSYRETINDPLMNNLLRIENFKNILPIVEDKMVSEEEVLDCDIVVANSKIPLEGLLKLKEKQVIVDVQGAIPSEDIKQSKAKYVKIW